MTIFQVNFMTISANEREKKTSREGILNSAEKLFFEKGYENVSMDDIATETELTISTLDLYFKSKEEIYLAINKRGSRILRLL